jgi:hypothetical protein
MGPVQFSQHGTRLHSNLTNLAYIFDPIIMTYSLNNILCASNLINTTYAFNLINTARISNLNNTAPVFKLVNMSRNFDLIIMVIVTNTSNLIDLAHAPFSLPLFFTFLSN